MNARRIVAASSLVAFQSDFDRFDPANLFDRRDEVEPWRRTFGLPPENLEARFDFLLVLGVERPGLRPKPGAVALRSKQLLKPRGWRSRFGRDNQHRAVLARDANVDPVHSPEREQPERRRDDPKSELPAAKREVL